MPKMKGTKEIQETKETKELKGTRGTKEIKGTRGTKEIKRSLENLPNGAIRYPMTNDYMFRAVLQENTYALKGLLCAILGLPEEEIQSIQIMNPIELGKSIDEKTCVLDLKVMLNNSRIINIEMQVNDLGNWSERSLFYLCRSFAHLQKGDDYLDAYTTIHVGILDFSLPNLTPELLSEFKMMNTKNHEIYSDKLILYVLNLSVLENTEEDTACSSNSLYHWAKFFKARTWEELKMSAEANKYIADAAVTFYEMTEEDKIREQCEAIEKYNWDMSSAVAKGKREGKAEGRAEGRAEGKAEERQEIAELIKRLTADNRLQELAKLETDKDILQKLMNEYGL